MERAASRRAGVLALVFAIAFIVLFLAPPFLPFRFPLYSLIDWADVVDLATPLVLIPLYWALFVEPGRPRAVPWIVLFILFAVAWVEGHGIHLAANATGHLLKDQPGPAQDLTEFWDEKFGHYLWHGALLALSALVLVRQVQAPDRTGGPGWMGFAAAAVYGLAIFLIGDEGGTAFVIVPFAIIVLALAWRSRRRLTSAPIVTLFAAGYPIALVLFAIWFVYWGGTLPQFSDIGLIK